MAKSSELPFRVLACALWLALASYSSAHAQAATFANGDLSTLSCRVVEARQRRDALSQLWVEVTNRGVVAAEPLVFHLACGDKKAPRDEVFVRVGLPRHRRYGRPTPAGGKQTYVIACAGEVKKGQCTVTVTEASFYSGGVVPAPDLSIGAPQQVQRTSLAGQFPVTQVDLHNPFDRDLDVLMLVTFTQPFDIVELMGVRIPAGATLPWLLATRPGPRSCYLDAEATPGCAMKATAFEVVDWSLVGDDDPAAGAALLQPAYERWLRWPGTDLEISGTFRFYQRHQRGNSSAYDEVAVAGRFTLTKPGHFELQIDGGGGANPSLEFQTAFALLRRPSFDELRTQNQLVPITTNRVEIRGRGWDSFAAQTSILSTGGSRRSAGLQSDLEVQGDVIVGAGRGDGPRERWQAREVNGAFVVTRIESSSQTFTIDYGTADGLVVPTRVTNTVGFGDKLFSSSELVLGDLRTDAKNKVVPVLPAGDGAAALRALWDASYHMPTGPIETTASFEVAHPGTDGVWHGVRKIRGKVAMTGIGRHLRDAHFEFDGKLAPETELGVASAFRDRLLMWYGRDFNDRPPFDEFFAGATIHGAGPDGTFRIEHGRIAAVRTGDGLVRGFDAAAGGAQRFTYTKFGDQMAVTKIVGQVVPTDGRSSGGWTETVTITLVRCGDALLPTKLQFESIFGKDWGPETITLQGLQVR